MMQLQVSLTHKMINFLNNQFSSIVFFNLYKYSALFLALLATIPIIFFIIFPRKSPSIPHLVANQDYSDKEDETEQETCSVSSTLSDFEEDDNEEEENRASEYFSVRGSGNGDGGFLRNCSSSIGDIFSLSEIANSKSVVKLWDTIGLGFGLDDSDPDSDSAGERSIVSVYGTDEKQSASSSVVVPAGENVPGNLALRIWDTRLRRRIPAVIAEWAPGIGKTVGFETGGVGKVYVRDNGRYELTVGEMRKNVSSPLENVTESYLDLLWPNSYMLNRNI